MYTKKVLGIYKTFLSWCLKATCISFAWDSEKDRLCVLKSGGKLRQFQAKLLFAVVHNVFLICGLLLRDIPGFGISYHMLAIYFTIGYCMCNGCRIVAYFLQDEIVKLVNAQLDFEHAIKESRTVNQRRREQNATKWTNLKLHIVSHIRGFAPLAPAPLGDETGGCEKFERNLLVLGLMTGISVPLLVFAILMAHPCLPPFIGSALFNYEGNKCFTTSWWAYGGLGLLNFWMHLDMVLPFVFTMFGLFFMSIALMQDYLHIVRRDFHSAMVDPRKSSKDNGTLEEFNSGNKGKYGNRSAPMESACQRYQRAFTQYRSLQLLEKQLNICFQDYYFPIFLGGMTCLLIFCLNACIRLPGKIPMPGFSYFPMVAFDGIVSLLVMNTRAANMRELSVEMIREWRGSPFLPRRHWVKKMSRSLSPLNIKLGVNYVDNETPLVTLDFTVHQVVSLLLIQN